MAKAVWHYTDKKTGKRTEVWLDEKEQAIDQLLVPVFESLEGDAAAGKAIAPSDVRAVRIAEDAQKLPPLKRQHWLEELERIGVRAGKAAAASEGHAAAGPRSAAAK